jgi:hypothetical protein
VTRPCRDHEVEIAAAGAGDLPADVAEHVEGCGTCRGLRQDALRTARAARREAELTEAAALSLARRAVDAARGRRPLWILPLVSASASAAALILYFGLSAPGQGEAREDGTGAGAQAVVPEPGQTELPDSLRAVSEMIVTSKEKTQ